MKQFIKLSLVVLVLGTILALAPRGVLLSAKQQSRQRNLKNRVEAVTRGDFREVRSNGIPDHPYGRFPNRRNPNTVSEQNHTFRLPLEPGRSQRAIEVGLAPFGIAVNGVPFDPSAAEFWNRDFNSGWQYEALSGKVDLGLDENNAHVQPNGAYHYHGLPTGLIKKLGEDKKMLLIGFAADGFPIYAQRGFADPNDPDGKTKKMRSSYRLKQGRRPNGPRGRYDGTFVEDYEYVADAGDLDECHGRYGVTPEYPEGTYHYFITDEFPFISRYFRGPPDESFLRRGPGLDRRGPGRRGPGRGGPGQGKRPTRKR